MPSYILLEEKWIPAVDMDGNNIKISINDVFLNGKKIKRLREYYGNELCEYVNYRFFITMYMDIKRKTLKSDAKKRYEYLEGEITEKEYFDYIAMCKEEGVTFDLLDEERPFLQIKRKEFEKYFLSKSEKELDKQNVYCNNLSTSMPTGSSPVFYSFKNRLERTPLPLDEYANLLLFRNSVTPGAGCGYKSSVIGKTASLIIIEGENLYETLVLNSVPIVVNNDVKPFYRWEEIIEFKHLDKIKKNPIGGMFYPYAMIYPDLTTVDMENKTIGKMYKMAISKSGYDKDIDEFKEIWLKELEPHLIKDKSGNFVNAFTDKGLFRLFKLLGIVKSEIIETDEKKSVKEDFEENIKECKKNKSLPLNQFFFSRTMDFYMKNLELLKNTNLNIYNMEVTDNTVVRCTEKLKAPQIIKELLESEYESNYISSLINKTKKIYAGWVISMPKDEIYDMSSNRPKLKVRVNIIRRMYYEKCESEMYKLLKILSDLRGKEEDYDEILKKESEKYIKTCKYYLLDLSKSYFLLSKNLFEYLKTEVKIINNINGYLYGFKTNNQKDEKLRLETLRRFENFRI